MCVCGEGGVFTYIKEAQNMHSLILKKSLGCRRVKVVLGWNIAIWGENGWKKNHKNNFSYFPKIQSLWLGKVFFCLLIVFGNYSTKRTVLVKKLMVISWQDKISLLHFCEAINYLWFYLICLRMLFIFHQ